MAMSVSTSDDDEQNPGNIYRRTGDSTKAEDTRNECDDKKRYRPTKHDVIS